MDGTTIILLCISNKNKFSVRVPTNSKFDHIFEKVSVKSKMESDGIELTFSVGSLVDVAFESDEDAEIMFSQALKTVSEIVEIKVHPRKEKRSIEPLSVIGESAHGKSSSEESDDDINECISDENIMPDGIDSEEDDSSDYLDNYCRHNEKILKTERWKHSIRMVGQIFHDGSNQFRLELAKYAIVSGFEYAYKKNEPYRVTVNCKFRNSVGCEWFIHAIYNKARDYFYIRKMYNKHTCNRVYRKLDDSRMVCSIVADEVFDQFNHKPVISPKDVVLKFKKIYGLDISYMMAWRGVHAAKEKYYGMHSSFMISWSA